MHFTCVNISRDDNDEADALARIGSKQEAVPPDVFLHHLHKPSIKGGDEDYPLSVVCNCLFGET